MDAINNYQHDFFDALQDALEAKGVNLLTEYGNDHLLVGQYSNGKVRGVYLRKAGPIADWTPQETLAIRRTFPFTFDGLTIDLVSIDQVESDDDRDYQASFALIPKVRTSPEPRDYRAEFLEDLAEAQREDCERLDWEIAQDQAEAQAQRFDFTQDQAEISEWMWNDLSQRLN